VRQRAHQRHSLVSLVLRVWGAVHQLATLFYIRVGEGAGGVSVEER
jgi:hypothetical protein